MAGHIIYSDEREVFTGLPRPYMEQPATQIWGRHLSNYRLLRFIETHSDDRAEVAQARREIVVCERKMSHWQRHPNWDPIDAGRLRAAADAIWESSMASAAEQRGIKR